LNIRTKTDECDTNEPIKELRIRILQFATPRSQDLVVDIIAVDAASGYFFVFDAVHHLLSSNVISRSE